MQSTHLIVLDEVHEASADVLALAVAIRAIRPTMELKVVDAVLRIHRHHNACTQ